MPSARHASPFGPADGESWSFDARTHRIEADLRQGALGCTSAPVCSRERPQLGAQSNIRQGGETWRVVNERDWRRTWRGLGLRSKLRSP